MSAISAAMPDPRLRAGVGAAGDTDVLGTKKEDMNPPSDEIPTVSPVNIQLPYSVPAIPPSVPVIKSVLQSILAAPASNEAKSIPALNKTRAQLLDKRMSVFTLLFD
jgi:hypothetical protein